MLSCHILSYPFTFNLFVPLHLKCVSCRLFIQGTCFRNLIYDSMPFDWTVQPYACYVFIDRIVVNPTILLIISCSIFSPSQPSLGKVFLLFHFISFIDPTAITSCGFVLVYWFVFIFLVDALNIYYISLTYHSLLSIHVNLLHIQ